MEIKKNGWFFKIAYGNIKCCQQPKEVGLCKAIWRFTFMITLGWPGMFLGALLVAVLFIIPFCLFYLVNQVLGFWFGWKVASCPDYFFEPYKKWPTIKGVRILPIYFVIVYICGSIIHASYQAVLDNTLYSVNFWTYLSSISLSLILIILIRRFFKSEILYIFSEYVRAKKQKFCPTIKVV